MKIGIPFKKFLSIIFLVILLSGCSLFGMRETELSDEEKIQTRVEETINALVTTEVIEIDAGQPSPTVQIPTDTQTITITSSEVITPTATISPTISLTATFEIPMVSVSMNTNCRTGPGTIYDYIGGLLVGEQAEVVGRFGDGKYWIIKNPDRLGECWLWGEYATVSGSTLQLPEYTQPPTPTPTSTPTSTSTATVTPTPTLTVTATP